MRAIGFLERYSKYPEQRVAEREIEKNLIEWLPVITGVVTFTSEEVRYATAEQEMLLAVASNKKIEMLRGGV